MNVTVKVATCMGSVKQNTGKAVRDWRLNMWGKLANKKLQASVAEPALSALGKPAPK
jgi:hypothetical protein